MSTNNIDDEVLSRRDELVAICSKMSPADTHTLWALQYANATVGLRRALRDIRREAQNGMASVSTALLDIEDMCNSALGEPKRELPEEEETP